MGNEEVIGGALVGYLIGKNMPQSGGNNSNNFNPPPTHKRIIDSIGLGSTFALPPFIWVCVGSGHAGNGLDANPPDWSLTSSWIAVGVGKNGSGIITEYTPFLLINMITPPMDADFPVFIVPSNLTEMPLYVASDAAKFSVNLPGNNGAIQIATMN